MIDPLGDIALAADAVSAGAVRLVQKEVAVTQRYSAYWSIATMMAWTCW